MTQMELVSSSEPLRLDSLNTGRLLRSMRPALIAVNPSNETDNFYVGIEQKVSVDPH